jgi:hypothetical protein
VPALIDPSCLATKLFYSAVENGRLIVTKNGVVCHILGTFRDATTNTAGMHVAYFPR